MDYAVQGRIQEVIDCPNEREASGPSWAEAGLYPEGGCTTQPRVAQRTLGIGSISHLYPEGVVQPLQGRGPGWAGFPGCAARPWAVECNPFGVKNGSLPRRGCTTQPRVVQRTLGIVSILHLYPEGVVQPLQGRGPGWAGFPGCAARPWAVECNPFGVKNGALPRRGCTTQPRVAQQRTLGE